jgi:hypothetical protein
MDEIEINFEDENVIKLIAYFYKVGFERAIDNIVEIEKATNNPVVIGIRNYLADIYDKMHMGDLIKNIQVGYAKSRSNPEGIFEIIHSKSKGIYKIFVDNQEIITVWNKEELDMFFQKASVDITKVKITEIE